MTTACRCKDMTLSRNADLGVDLFIYTKVMPPRYSVKSKRVNVKALKSIKGI